METRNIKYPQLIDLLDGYFMCAGCKKIAPIISLSKHVSFCDVEQDDDITVYDKEVQSYFDILLTIDYYHNPKVTDYSVRRHLKAHVMSSFPHIMLERLSNKLKEQKFVTRQIDHREHTHPSSIEKTEIKVIRDMIPLKRIDLNVELY